MIYLQLFITFFKIGIFGFGGGYAMLSLIQYEVVATHSWMTVEEFTDMVAISQMTPGSISINTATFAGYTATGNVWGAAVATLSLCLPSFIIMLTICKLFTIFRKNPYISTVFKVLRFVAVGLITAAALMLVNATTFADIASVVILSVAFIVTWKFKVNPIITIVLAGLFGALYY